MKYKIKKETKIGTGFFIKTNINGKICKCLCTNNHIISQEYVDSNKEFNFYYGKKNNETKKTIKLDSKKRFIACFKEPKDVCLIEIIKNDNIPEDKYLLPDLNYKHGFNTYENKKFYLAGYPRGNNQFLGERHISSGKIKEIKGFQFSHTLDKSSGSSGSPICLINNQNIIGLHKSGSKSRPINYGTFIGIILDDLEKYDKNDTAKFLTFEKTNIKDMNSEKVNFIAGCPAFNCFNSRKAFNWKHDYCREQLLLDENANIICQRCQIKAPLISLNFKCDYHTDFREVNKEKIFEILSISSTLEKGSKDFKSKFLKNVFKKFSDDDSD